MPDSTKLPEVVGLCPDPSHTQEFYVPHGGTCPECEKEMVEYHRLPMESERMRSGGELTEVEAKAVDAVYFERDHGGNMHSAGIAAAKATIAAYDPEGKLA